VLGCWVATFFSTYAWGSLFAFFPLYAKDLGISIAQTGLIFTTQAGVNALCRIPIGHFQDRTGNRRSFILWGNALFGLCIALTGTARGPLPLYLLFAGVGATMAATFTAVGAVLSESVARASGIGDGGYNTCIYGGFNGLCCHARVRHPADGVHGGVRGRRTVVRRRDRRSAGLLSRTRRA